LSCRARARMIKAPDQAIADYQQVARRFDKIASLYRDLGESGKPSSNDGADILDYCRDARSQLVLLLPARGKAAQAQNIVLEDADSHRIPFCDPQNYTKRLLNASRICSLEGRWPLSEFTCQCAIQFWNEYFWLNPARKPIVAEQTYGPTIAD